jgi:prolyl oligopeptidase
MSPDPKLWGYIIADIVAPDGDLAAKYLFIAAGQVRQQATEPCKLDMPGGKMKQRLATIAIAAVLSAMCSEAPLPAQAAGESLTSYPAQPRSVPFRETVFGNDISDPWRWMEDAGQKAQLTTWMQASSAHTRAQLSALPGYPALLSAITTASRAKPGIYQVSSAGGRLFFGLIAPDANQPVLMVRENGRDRVLVDPGKDAAIGTYQASPDGRFVVVQLSKGGSEIGASYIYDVANGKRLDDVLTPMWSDQVNWADGRTLLYTRMARTEGKNVQEDVTLYRHVIGRPASEDAPLLGSLARTTVVVSKEEAALPGSDVGSAWMIGVIGQARPDSRIALARTADLVAGRAAWVPVADYEDRITRATVHGDTLYYITQRELPDGEVRSVDARAPKLSASRRVLGGGGLVLKEIVAARDGLYVTALRPTGSSRLLFLRYGAAAPVEVRLPFAGAIGNVSAPADGGSPIVSIVGWLNDMQYLRLDGGKATSVGIGNETDAAVVAGARLIEEVATSKDGTKVPLTILAPSATFAGARPTILEAYSSYGSVAAPFFGPVTLTWVRRGGVFATCHARGGGEQGRAWHEAGRSHNKPRGQEDVIACGERLVALGFATPRTLGAWGTSAGGTIVPPAALARPDLFRAVTASVGMVNPTALDRGENGASQFAEFGDPRTAEGYEALVGQDTTMLVPKSRGGPDFLFTVGLNDHRVPFWHSAKAVATMRAAWQDRHLALLRVDDDAGHGVGSGRDKTLALRADMYAFFLNRFGQPGFEKP